MAKTWLRSKKWKESPYCFYCGCKTSLKTPKKYKKFNSLTATLEHLYPRWLFTSEKVRNNPENIVIACQKCNNERDNKKLMMFSLNDRKQLYKKFELLNHYKRCKVLKNDTVRLFLKPLLFLNCNYLVNLFFNYKKFLKFYKRKFYRKIGIKLKK